MILTNFIFSFVLSGELQNVQKRSFYVSLMAVSCQRSNLLTLFGHGGTNVLPAGK